MPELTLSDLAELEALVEKMTESPWVMRSTQHPADGDLRFVFHMSPPWTPDHVEILASSSAADKSGHGRQHRDAAGIVALRNSASGLIQQAREAVELRARVEELQRQLADETESRYERGEQ